MRSLGEFFGHIIAGVKEDPTRSRHEVRRTVEEEDRGDVVLRRTTIEEIEIRPGAAPRSAAQQHAGGADTPPGDPSRP